MRAGEWATVAALAILVVAVPFLGTSGYVLRVGNVVLIYAILALGLNFTVGWTGQISLGHAAFWGIGAYTSAFLSTSLPWFPSWLALMAGATAACLAGICLGLPTLKVKGHYLALATLGFGEVVQLVFNNWREVTNGSDGIGNIPPLGFAGFVLSSEAAMFDALAVALVLLALVARQIRHSTFGRAFIAIRDDELAASVSGVPTTTTKTLAFALGALYAGIAGGFYAHLFRYISPDVFGFEQSLLVLSMLVIGGIGSIAGAIIGAVVGVALPELLRVFGVYSTAIYTAIVISMIIFVPGGLAGLARGEWRGRRARPLARSTGPTR